MAFWRGLGAFQESFSAKEILQILSWFVAKKNVVMIWWNFIVYLMLLFRLIMVIYFSVRFQ